MSTCLRGPGGDGSGTEALADGLVLGAEGVVPQELGACYTSPDYVRVMALLEEVGLTEQLVTVPPRNVHSATGAPGVAFASWTAMYLIQSLPGSMPEGVDCTAAENAQTCAAAAVGVVLQKLAAYEVRPGWQRGSTLFSGGSLAGGR